MKANHGAPGPDGVTLEQFPEHFRPLWPEIRQQLLDGAYWPQAVRRKAIAKQDGGERLLGIPNVQERLIQQAILQVLQPIFDPGFSESSFGFRQKRSAHGAIKQAKRYVKQGYRFAVNMDLSKFFDRVQHDVLMSCVSRKATPYSDLGVIAKSNWTGTGLVVPRRLLSEAKSRDEFNRTGVYVLVGDHENELPTIYIGQGDPVRRRLVAHLTDKDFWSWAVFFVTRDDSLNKAHIGHLEAELIRLAQETKRAKLDNSNVPQPSPLSDADAADMGSFLADIVSILPLVGLSVFEKPRGRSSENSLLHRKNREINATAYESSQGLVVQQGAMVVVEERPSIQAYQSALRAQLKDQGVLVPSGDHLVLTQDYEFSSSSTAASVLLGRPTSGPAAWKDEQARTLKQLQEQQAGHED